jgi:hypothetical protein
LTRRAFAAIVAVCFLALAGGAASSPRKPRPCHPTRHHRCKKVPRRHPRPKPVPKPVPLPRRLEVDENDQGQLPLPYSLRPSHNPVGTGTVQFNVYNFGQDDHTFAVADASGHQFAHVDVPANQPGNAVPVNITLPPGTYTLECTLQGHAALGMVATLTVK